MITSLAYSYLAIGAIISGAMYLIYYEPKSQFAKDVDEALNGSRSWHYKLREVLVIPCTLLLITAVWPLALWMIIVEWQKKRNIKPKKTTAELFAVKPHFLLEKVTIAQAEAQEIYLDPLGVTPVIPFGYLYDAWSAFKTSFKDGDELWTFIVPKGEPIGEYEILSDAEMRGYALVRNRKIVGEFVCDGSGAY